MATSEPRGRLPAEFMAELRRRTDIVQVVGERVALRPAGRELVGLCPFHEEKTPSFSVSAERGVFYCHGCHAGGDAVSFVQRIGGVPFAEAVAILAERAGLQVPRARPPSAAEARRMATRAEVLAALEAAAAFYTDRLIRPEGAEAIAYLRTRGVDGPTAERFGLGFAPAGWQALVEALGATFPLERLVGAGLAAPRQSGSGAYDRFRRRLMFPIRDGRGRVIGFGGRALDPSDEPKYLNSPDTEVFDKGRVLYGLDLARPALGRRGRAVVVEGYMDVLACHQFGFTETVATLGTSLTAEQAGVLARAAESIILAYDADAAGGAATERGLGVLEGAGARVAVATLPVGADPDDLLRRGGPQAFTQVLDAAEPLIRYLVHRALADGNIGRRPPAERWDLAMRVAPFLARLPEGARREGSEWVSRQMLVAEPADYRRAVQALAERNEGHRNSKSWNASRVKDAVSRPRVRSGADAAEETVLAACLQSAERLRRLRPHLTIYDFRHPAHKALAQEILARGAAAGAEDGSAGLEVAAADDRGVAPATGRTPPPTAGADGSRELHAAGPSPSRESGTKRIHAGGAEEPAAEGAETRPPVPGLALLDSMADEELRARLARLLALDLSLASDAVLQSCLATMRRARLLGEVDRLRAEQRRLEADGQGLGAEMRRLTRSLTELTAELARSARGGSDG